MKKFIFFILFFIFCIGIFFFLIIYYKILLCKNYHNNDIPLKKANAVVILTGGKGRISEGLKFLSFPNIKYVIISGANPKSSKKDILSSFKTTENYKFFKKIIIECNSKNTVENAVETKKLASKLNLNTLIIVTSCTHIYRSRFIFNHVFKNKKYKIYFWKSNEKISSFKIIKEVLKLIFDYFYLFFLTISN